MCLRNGSQVWAGHYGCTSIPHGPHQGFLGDYRLLGMDFKLLEFSLKVPRLLWVTEYRLNLWSLTKTPELLNVFRHRFSIPVCLIEASWMILGHSADFQPPWALLRDPRWLWITGNGLQFSIDLNDCSHVWMDHWEGTSFPCRPLWGFLDDFRSLGADSIPIHFTKISQMPSCHFWRTSTPSRSY